MNAVQLDRTEKQKQALLEALVSRAKQRQLVQETVKDNPSVTAASRDKPFSGRHEKPDTKIKSGKSNEPTQGNGYKEKARHHHKGTDNSISPGKRKAKRNLLTSPRPHKRLAPANKKTKIAKLGEKIPPQSSDNSAKPATEDSTTPDVSVVNESTGKYVVLGGHEVTAKTVGMVVPDWFRDGAPVSRDITGDSVDVAGVEWLDEWAKKALIGNGFTNLFPVQCKVVYELLHGLRSPFLLHPPDICVSAPTGSGKTLSYVIPILHMLRTQMVPSVRALVVVPVQELVGQVEEVFRRFSDGTSLKVVGLSSFRELADEVHLLVRQCERRGLTSIANVVVATPGRLVDQMRSIDRLARGLNTNFHWLGELRFLVIDEADRLMSNLKLDWLEAVEKAVYFSGLWDGTSEGKSNQEICKNESPAILRSFGTCLTRYSPGSACIARLEKNPVPLQKILLSATLSHDPEQLQQLNLFQPKLFSVLSGSNRQADGILVSGNLSANVDDKHDETAEQEEMNSGASSSVSMSIPSELIEKYCMCKSKLKPLLCGLLLKENTSWKRILCFCNSNENAQRLAQLLRLLAVESVKEYSSCVHRNILHRTFKQFVAGNIRILVCSDRMARGLDVENVDVVISYDVPTLPRTYVHRVGRTARAGKAGMALTLLGEEELLKFQKLLSTIGHWTRLVELQHGLNLKASLGQYRTALEKLKDVIKMKRKRKKPNN